MAKSTSLYTCHEVVIDQDGNETERYRENLPHGKEIVKNFISKWNKDADKFMLKIMNEQVGKGKIKSCYARQYKKNGPETTIAIEIVAKEGKQFRGAMKEDIFDFMTSQFSDGWGEGFFGPINIYEDGDISYYID